MNQRGSNYFTHRPLPGPWGWGQNSTFSEQLRNQRGRQGVRIPHPLENHKLYGFLYGISNWTLGPPLEP